MEKSTLKHPHLYIYLLLILSPAFSAAQSESASQFTTQIAPLPPNAAALAKYVDVPVSYYTGTPQISVPIYELKGRSVSVPISISYHASGNKVDDVASNIGLGWSLNAGGMISRSMRGLADESFPYGYLRVGSQIENPGADCDNSNLAPCNYLRNNIDNLIDSEPDVFFLTLPGGGGAKFAFHYDGSVVLQSYQQIQIIKDAAMTNWTVTTADGIQYKFGKTGAYGARDALTISPNDGVVRGATSTWHLSHIISADRLDTVFFEYHYSSSFEYDDPKQESYYQRDYYAMGPNPIMGDCRPISAVSKSPGSTAMTQSSISKIISARGTVEFFQSASQRSDLENNKSLDSIRIKKNDEVLIKSFGLRHGYMGNVDNYRLKLTEVVEYSSAGQALPPYEFYYDERNTLPVKNSFKQDHWGYYNANRVNSFIPNRINKGDGSFIVFSQGGDRETDSTLVKTGMLNKVVYPLGGFDTFEYESNDVYKVGNQVVKEYYDEVYDYKVNTYASHHDESKSGSIVIDVVTSATITVGGGCHGNCGWNGNSCERAAASATFIGPVEGVSHYVNISWGCQTVPHSEEWVLKPGTYNFAVQSDWLGADVYGNASVKITLHKQRDVLLNSYQPVGGVRIKRIKRYSSTISKPKVTRFKYTTTVNGSNVSSGVLVRKPNYYSRYSASTFIESAGVAIICPYDAAYSSSKVSLGEGSHIGYSEVQVLSGEHGENGFEIFKYTTAANYPDTGGDKFPNPPADSRDTRRGLLKEHIIKDKDENPITQTINTYKFSTDHYGYAKGLKVGMSFPRSNDHYLSDYTMVEYFFWQEWQYPDQVTERLYSSLHDGSYKELVTKNYYERPANHVFVTRQEKTQSDGSVITTLFKYPQDYATGATELSNINTMVSRHIYTSPVEIQNWKGNGGTAVLLSGRITDYETDTFKPSKIYTLNLNTPISSLNNETTTAGLYNTLLSDNTKYELRAQMNYQSGNLVSQHKDKDTHTSYVWGYANTEPIAEVVNGDPALIAFTSFEEKSDGNWIIASTARDGTNFLTGTKGYSLSNGNVVKTSLDASKKYAVTFWARVGNVTVNGATPTIKSTVNGWSFNVINISAATITISGSAVIDELRLHPADAMMTSYTFDPLVGITSAANASNEINYYLYDNFNRLTILKDYKGNILKRYTYNYAPR